MGNGKNLRNGKLLAAAPPNRTADEEHQDGEENQDEGKARHQQPLAIFYHRGPPGSVRAAAAPRT